MKVLQINSVCGYGSTGRIATDIYKVLVEQGHESVIAYGRGSAPEGINCIRIGTKFDNYIHLAKTRLFDQHGFSSKKATKEFIEKVREYNPDVIHLHNIHGYYIHIELLFDYLKEANKQVIWTLHDCWAFTGHCSYFDYVGCHKWRIACNHCIQKKEYPKSLWMDCSKSNYDRKKELFTGIKKMCIVTPSNWLAQLVKQSYLKEYEVKVINNGINLSVFTPRDNAIVREKYKLEDKFVILGVASIWDDKKGFDYMVELSKVMDDRSRMIMVGLSKKQLRKLPENIIGIERTNNIDELVALYSAADVFVNPTLEDNFPTTNLEALACGTPVITFHTGGSIEPIDESCGITVEKESLPGLIDAIEVIRRMGKGKLKESCRKRACRIYDWNDRICDYSQLYLRSK